MTRATGRPALRDIVERVVLVAYREDTSALEVVLHAEGFADLVVQRPVYSEAELGYSRDFRCFMNHRNAWRDAMSRDGWTLILEADFVPCQGFGSLPMPVPNPDQPGLKWAFLYTSSPRILWEEAGGYLRGHQSTAVCYLVSGAVAAKLLEFYEDEVAAYGVGSYFLFDTHMQWALTGKGCDAYFPLRSFGEHGGTPNPEHRARRMTGAGGRHRADVLAAPLAFLPQYAAGSVARYWSTRLGGRLRSLARLPLGKWFARVDVHQVGYAELPRLFWLGFRRHLPV